MPKSGEQLDQINPFFDVAKKLTIVSIVLGTYPAIRSPFLRSKNLKKEDNFFTLIFNCSHDIFSCSPFSFKL